MMVTKATFSGVRQRFRVCRGIVHNQKMVTPLIKGWRPRLYGTKATFSGALMGETLRCTFFDRRLHSRMAIEFHAFAPLEALPCV
jgi:hypothetical protein